jgi:hypothetical protein
MVGQDSEKKSGVGILLAAALSQSREFFAHRAVQSYNVGALRSNSV